jgi:hypothetical protein
VSEKLYRDKIAAIKKQQGAEETALGKARAAAAKHRSDAAKERAKVTPRTSDSMARSYQRAAEAAEKRAVAEDGKVSKHSKKLGQLATDLANAEASLDREIKATARRNESAQKAAARRAEQDDARRRQAEKRHAQEIARISQPVVRYVHEVRAIPAPKPEVLRVLYLTENPELDLRTEVEVRDVRQAVRAATHRDLIEIISMPAATPEDLLDGLNDVRPHVVHLSSHAGEETVVFDNASIESPAGREVTFDLLAKALGATGDPPVLLVSAYTFTCRSAYGFTCRSVWGEISALPGVRAHPPVRKGPTDRAGGGPAHDPLAGGMDGPTQVQGSGRGRGYLG